MIESNNKCREMVPLKGWAKYCDLMNKQNKDTINNIKRIFSNNIADISRFAWRYRLAKSFRAIEVKDMGKQTIEGYTSIFRLFLVYSAWDMYHDKVLGDKLRGNDKSKIIANRKTIPSKDVLGLLMYLDSYLNPRMKEVVNIKLNRIDYEMFARAIRHVFVHGNFTYNIRNTKPRITKKICNMVSNELLEVMDEDFSRKVDMIRASVSD